MMNGLPATYLLSSKSHPLPFHKHSRYCMMDQASLGVENLFVRCEISIILIGQLGTDWPRTRLGKIRWDLQRKREHRVEYGRATRRCGEKQNEYVLLKKGTTT